VISPASPPVVILPGIGMSHRYSTRLQRALEQRGGAGAEVHSFDLPGFGGRPKPRGGITVEGYAQRIAAAFDARGIRAATVFGHSMGAQFAVELARIRPELVGRLVLAAPVVDPARRTRRQQSLDLVRDLIAESPSSAALIVGDFLRTGPPFFFAALDAMLDHRIEPGVREARCPILVVRGHDDPIARAEWCRTLAGTAADGRFLEVEGAGHILQHTAARTLARVIDDFAASTPVPASAAAPAPAPAPASASAPAPARPGPGT
jgi:pimeloyl-ACP methyl ester carboxylesterase